MTAERSIGMTARSAVKALAVRSGTEHRLRALRSATDPYTTHRNERDNAALRAVMTAVLRIDSCCVDVGANVGEILREMARLAPRGRHIAFEPLADHAQRLTIEFPGVDVRNVALGHRNGQAQFLRRAHPALSSLETVPETEDPETYRGPIYDGAQRTTVTTRRLDDEIPPPVAARGPWIKYGRGGASLALFLRAPSDSSARLLEGIRRWRDQRCGTDR